MDTDPGVVDDPTDADAVRDQAAVDADSHGDEKYDPEQPFAAAGYTIDREHGTTEVSVMTADGPKTCVVPVAIDPVARIREDDVTVGVLVHLIDKDGAQREVFIRTEEMGGRDPYGKLLRATGYAFTEGDAWDSQLKHVKKLLIKATTHRGIRAMNTLSEPRWDGDRLRVPGITDTPSPDHLTGVIEQHYGPALVEWATLDAGDDSDAREAWRQIIAYGARHPKLGLVIGMALSSAYLPRLRVRGTTVHIGGVSTRGKTLGSETGISAIGNPRENEVLAGTWDTTYVGIIARLKGTGGLPYMLDETSLAVGQYEQNLERVPYAVWAGKERGRGNVDGNARDQARFTLNLISTGEQDLADAMGGAYARVVVRPEDWIRPAGVSPARVVAGRPGSRPRFVVERRRAERGVESLFGGSKRVGRSATRREFCSLVRLTMGGPSRSFHGEGCIRRCGVPDMPLSGLLGVGGAARTRWPGSGKERPVCVASSAKTGRISQW